MNKHNSTVKKLSIINKNSRESTKESKPSIEKLQAYLKDKYGSKAIKVSSSNPNKNNQILV